MTNLDTILKSRDSETNRQSRFDALYRMLGAGALWMTQRDGMEREVGGWLRMGSTCTPVVDSC